LEAEQVREKTVIEHARIERRKEEELRRLNGEFERVSHILSQRKMYLTAQINTTFENLAKLIISDIAIAESQAEYAENLLTKLLDFYDFQFKQKKKSTQSPRSFLTNFPKMFQKFQIKSSGNINEQQSEEDKIDEDSMDEKKPIDITSLNANINASLPQFGKELLRLKKNFQDFSYVSVHYPQCNINSTFLI
jgi:hypothetical protein